MRPRSTGTCACIRGPQPKASVDARLGFGRTKGLTTRPGPIALPDEAHSDAHGYLKNVVYAAVFSGLAYFLTPRDDQHAGDLFANHAGPAADEYDRLRSVDVAWPKHAFHEVNAVHHPLGATGTAGAYQFSCAASLDFTCCG